MFSKHAWVQPVKNKTGQAVTVAFEKILKEGRKPINLQTDDGKEFYNKDIPGLDETEKHSSFFRPVEIPKPVSWNGSIGR